MPIEDKNIKKRKRFKIELIDGRVKNKASKKRTNWLWLLALQ